MSKIHPLVQPYQPSSDDPFDAVKAAHLLNRAGFGGTPEEIQKAVELGPEGAIDWLMDFPDAGADEQSQSDQPDLSSIEGYPRNFREIRKLYANKTQDERKALIQQLMAANREALQAIVYWWMKRMSRGPYPFQEKLTLFWHGHFTTSAKDERQASLMWNQNELLRRNAAGNFRTFVREISRDPAMLDYLNNQQNRKSHPNENYARELMELFTLGIGNYTETDIKQSARAFTGWGHDGDEYIFRRFDHDEGEKVFFGRRGNFNGDDIIEIILEHPACAPYIAGKMFKFFVYEDPESGVCESLGALLKENKWELRPLVRTIFTSKAFYSPRAIGSQIKSPIQLVAGTIRLLGLNTPRAEQLNGALNQMGQVPLAPPNVKGWPGGRNWINTSTLFVRYNTCVYLAGGQMPGARGQLSFKKGVKERVRGTEIGSFDPKDGKDATPQQIVDDWLARLIQRPVEPDKRQVLVDSMQGETRDPAVRKVVQLIVSMPEYQLC